MADLPLNVIHIIQGQFRVSDAADTEMTTVLGSCVAACLFDPFRKVGGMNHFLLPGNDPSAGNNIRYGAHSMEQLINAMLRAGAHRNRLEVQLFGGANVVQGLSRIGDSNAFFARDFVRQEGFILRGDDTGGTFGRRLRFRPATGAARVERVDPARANIPQAEQPVRRPAPPACSVELF
ncbi:MAG: chemotaxis protein CheD [Roseovarius sp.]|uniref:chemotaxis protein CheD n=1 Tax=Roseovarius sp. TaxID=1486281 RepID=UPI0032EC690D